MPSTALATTGDPNAAALTGAQKIAILLMYLGESAAGEVLHRLDEEEILAVGQCMASVETVPAPIVEAVVTEFCERFTTQKGLTVRGRDYLQRVVHTGLGEDRARRILRGLNFLDQRSFQEKLSNLSPEAVASLLRSEHPQTIAVAIAMLTPRVASSVLLHLNAELRNDVLFRMAHLDRVSPEVQEQLREFIDQELKVPAPEPGMPQPGSADRGRGYQSVAEVLNAMGKQRNESILQLLGERDEKVVEEIVKRMFTFEDLMRVDDKGIQSLLKEVKKQDLALALKMADEEIQSKFLRNMSERAAEFLREDMEVMGAVRFKDVEAAQRNIVTLAKRLEEAGKIYIATKDGDDA